MRFGLIGAAGFVAPRHMRAIHDVGGELVAAYDQSDSVGVLDRWHPDCELYRSRGGFFIACRDDAIDTVAVTTPNDVHEAHAVDALRAGCDVICEKPLTTSTESAVRMREAEQRAGKRVNVVLQLRQHPQVATLRKQAEHRRVDVDLTYVTRRGRWYHSSWKGDHGRSGGLALNIGVHFFDLLLWLYGSAHDVVVHARDGHRASGVLELERARVRWFLSVDADDLPAAGVEPGGHACRRLLVDGESVDLSAGFEDAHTRVYQRILDGEGWGIDDAVPAIGLVGAINRAELVSPCGRAHRMVRAA